MSADSVGKISLDLEVKSDINAQVNTVSNNIANSIKQSLNTGLKSAFQAMNSIAKQGASGVGNTINKILSNSVGRVKNTLQSALSALKNIRVSTPQNFSRIPQNNMPRQAVEATSNISGRAPPRTSVDMTKLTTEIDNTAKALDIVNAKIEQQQAKLAQLKEAYSTCFNANRKNALEEKILKTEASINRLVGQSDRLGFKLNDLDAKLANAGNSTNSTNNSIKRYSNNINEASKNTGKFASKVNSMSGSIVGNFKKMYKYAMAFMGFKVGIRAIRAIGKYLRETFKANEEFANSLNQVKTNLMVAFTPILQAVMPILNTFMSWLAKATTYIASFVSAIFGKTYQQSYKATQQLIDAKAAMGAYGSSAKKAAKEVKGLAAIDEINTLGKVNDNSSSDSIPKLVTPPLDTSATDGAMKKLVDRIKDYLNTIDFKPLINSFNRLKDSISPIINNIGKILKWFYDNILKPFAEWTITDLIPAFFNLLSGAFNVLNPLLEVFMDLGKWLWDEFLQPIASWTGGVIVDVLNGLADVLTKIGDWMKEHKTIIETVAIVVGSFALAWGLVNVAFELWFGLLNAYNAIVYIATGGTTALAAAFSALNWPLILTVAAIGAVIAIGILLYKHWDVVKEKCKEVWDWIKEKFNSFKEWLGNVFATDWSQKFGSLGDVMNGFLKNISNIWNSIKQIFNGIVDFVKGVFTGNWRQAWEGVKEIFKGIMEGLGAVVKAPLNAVIGLINGALSGLNKISFDVPDWIPGLGGKHFGVDISKIPYLAKGGIIDQPTLAMVGEAGKEAVVPLENNTQGIQELATMLMQYMSLNGNNNNSNSNQPLEVKVNMDGMKLAELLIKNINKLNRAAGVNLING